MTSLGTRTSMWSLRRRLAVLFAFVGAALTISVALTAIAVVHLRATINEQINRIDPAQIAAEQFLDGMTSQESGNRGYVSTRDRGFLSTYAEGENEEGTAYYRLHRLLSGEPALEADLAAVLQSARDWQTRTALPTIIETEAGASASSLTASLDAGRRQFAELRAQFGVFVAALGARHADADHAVTQADLLLVVLLALALVCLLTAIEGTLVALRRWVTRPMFALAGEARLVAEGDTDHAIAVAGPPEIRRLSEDVESMRRRIASDLETVESARRVLHDQAAQLRRSNLDLERFASVASHDLQEPLRKIASFSELLLRRYEDELDERGREYLLFVADGARRMQLLVNGVLELARVGRGGELAPVSTKDAADRAVENLAEEIAAAKATIDFGDLPVVRGDRALLVALFQNLIGNSLRFRSKRRPVVSIAVTELGEDWRFSVRDNGIGVDPQYSERIFEMFQKLQTRERYGGSGIGLALCRRIVEHHGGSIWLETSTDKGATVCFTIPRANLGAQPPPPSETPPAGGTLPARGTPLSRSSLGAGRSREGGRGSATGASRRASG